MTVDYFSLILHRLLTLLLSISCLFTLDFLPSLLYRSVAWQTSNCLIFLLGLWRKKSQGLVWNRLPFIDSWLPTAQKLITHFGLRSLHSLPIYFIFLTLSGILLLFLPWHCSLLSQPLVWLLWENRSQTKGNISATKCLPSMLFVFICAYKRYYKKWCYRSVHSLLLTLASLTVWICVHFLFLWGNSVLFHFCTELPHLSFLKCIYKEKAVCPSFTSDIILFPLKDLCYYLLIHISVCRRTCVGVSAKPEQPISCWQLY